MALDAALTGDDKRLREAAAQLAFAHGDAIVRHNVSSATG
jgi:hypothetical protein